MPKFFFVLISYILISGHVFANPVVLYTPAAGDASYSWNTKSGPWGYTTGALSMGIYLEFGGQYGNDHTVSIFEVPVSALAGKDVTSATLEVVSLGFGTGFWYGNAYIGWLDTGTASLTGDVVADALGPASMALPNQFTIYNSDYGDTPGLKSFDVSSYVLTDLAAGRSYSTFVMSGSRETWGSIYTAESGNGPRIVVYAVPEPSTLILAVITGLGLAACQVCRRT